MSDWPKALLRFAMAEQAFLEAKAMANHLLSAKMQDGSHLYQACVTGMATSYCRPFTAAEGLGKLPADFETFDDSASPAKFSEWHHHMLVGRNKFLAHFDLKFGIEKFTEGQYQDHPGKIILELCADGYNIRTNSTTMRPEVIQYFVELIDYQIKKLQEHQNKLIIAMIKEYGFKPGSYVVTPKGQLPCS